MPQRQVLGEVKTMTDLAVVLNYLEHLVEEWEEWGAMAEAVIEWENQKQN